MIRQVLWITRRALETLLPEDPSESLETGGILLGYVPSDSEDAVVLDVLGPGPHAVHNESGFEPDQEWQEQELAARYRATDGLHSYVGDWHTHPRGTAVPSRRDLAVLRRISGYDEARLSHPTMVIVSFDNTQVSLRAWRWNPVVLLGRPLWPRATEMTVRIVDAASCT